MTDAVVTLKKGEGRNLQKGGPWVYDNEIADISPGAEDGGLVRDGGFLATCSCSHFMDYELFTQTIGQAARNVHKRLRQVEYRTQSPDHPILWAADDSYYLKFYIFQVCNDR